MTRPTISVAMATYNGARYIREQLDSVAAQTYPPHELVVCDDGSTDSTPDIVQAFARLAPFKVRLYSNARRLGFADNFLKAASLCEGEWIAFCDQDDVWLAHKLAVMMHAAGRYPSANVIVHSAELVDADLRPSGRRIPDFKRTRFAAPLTRYPIGVATGFACAVKADLLERFDAQARPSDPELQGAPLSHDRFAFLLANAVGGMVFLHDSLALYRRHDAAFTDLNGLPRSSTPHLLGVPGFGLGGHHLLECSRFLQRHIGRVDGDLAAASRYYARAGRLLLLRDKAYTTRGPTRLGYVLALLCLGAYWPRCRTGFGTRALFRDLKAGHARADTAASRKAPPPFLSYLLPWRNS